VSGADIRRVKAAVADWIATAAVDAIKPGALAELIAERTGLDFGATTIARYLKANGWRRADPETPLGRGGFYVRPFPTEGGTGLLPGPALPNSAPLPVGADVAAGSSPMPASNPTGPGDRI
jgi:hypothetical protein